MMFDIQLLAFEMDLTRVVSLKTGRDASSRIFPESGVDKPFHAASHYGTDPETLSRNTTSFAGIEWARSPPSWRS